MVKNWTMKGIIEQGVSTTYQPELFPVTPIASVNQSVVADGTGLRYDAGKNRLELIPPEWEWELGRVLTAGATKYADRNWERGMEWSKVVGPLRRHLNRFLRGQQRDGETGAHHLAHVAWNALALMTYDLRKIGDDNLNRQDCIQED